MNKEMNDLVEYFYSGGDLSLMLCKIVVLLICLYLVSAVIACISKGRLR